MKNNLQALILSKINKINLSTESDLFKVGFKIYKSDAHVSERIIERDFDEYDVIKNLTKFYKTKLCETIFNILTNNNQFIKFSVLDKKTNMALFFTCKKDDSSHHSIKFRTVYKCTNHLTRKSEDFFILL